MSIDLTSICLRLCPGDNDNERVRTVTIEVTWHTGSCVEWNRDTVYPMTHTDVTFIQEWDTAGNRLVAESSRDSLGGGV